MPRVYDRLSREEIEVMKWREQQLLDRGVPAKDARDLADSYVDLHLMQDMLDRGCPPALLWRLV